MSINTASYGMLKSIYVKRIQNTLDKALQEYPRLFVLRVDLRLPDADTTDCNTDSAVITRFIASLKSQFIADLLKKHNEGKRVHPSRIRYIWAREFNQSDKKHYHVTLLLNREAYAYPGRYTAINGQYSHNLALMIMEAWVRALGLHTVENHTQYYALTEFPGNCYYHLSRNSENFTEQHTDVTNRLNYLAKEYSKDNTDGQRNFGCSQF
ncbi:inovirus Gp2 family protein [Enterobacter asburiae]|uniref:inovirus Gp2 family protein n=1 Tax=Enterobacter asburiae TaxID=61645 RepID=UPI00192AAEE2|nr:inovirus Gp2 family protein [Enterobacter asburiae]MBL5945901.1 inovirus Gp2 family protein [Enterobacter asburiae]MBL5954423.1 inovirus Gp2 family protein [Enterobacter asburiae]